ncbi:MAG: LolA family protein [Pedosphaera sp.]|nr:LolA family protein [Pedosphaera sp.]
MKNFVVLLFASCACFAMISQPAFAQTADDNALLTGWLNAQTNIQTWSADFTQTRRLKALTQPLIATGRVWFAAPNRFHWEIEKPSPTIAVRDAEQLWVIYPRLKRAEQYSLSSADAGPWKDTLALLDAGFPRSRAEVESRFNILAQTTANGIHELTLQPKAESARRFMPEIKIAFDTNTFSLHSTELKFADGSTMENVFTNPVLNPKLDESLFHPNVEGYKVTQPMKNSR